MKSMTFKVLLSFILVIGISFSSVAGKKKVLVSCSEPDAAIYSNGIKVGTGQAEVIVLSNNCITINIEKSGFLTVEETICYKKGFPKPPKTKYFEMLPDPAYDASVQTDMANTDIEIRLNTDRSEVENWKILNQIITNYFDVIEISDRETGYLRTAWNLHTFPNANIRTRLIVKLGSLSPLSYKVKLVSEIGAAGTSIKSDHKFTEWDRVLRTYETVIDQITSRLK
ncbi:MAG: hypothetical protein GQ527_06430 [Bacteroidales bacterium]|nr:hypothetical protein [Bacteroidales bacterium]